MARKNKIKTMIVKVQLSMDKETIIIYNENRRHNGIVKDKEAIGIITEAMEGKIKCYFKAEYIPNPPYFELLEIVEDQKW